MNKPDIMYKENYICRMDDELVFPKGAKIHDEISTELENSVKDNFEINKWKKKQIFVQ